MSISDSYKTLDSVTKGNVTISLGSETQPEKRPSYHVTISQGEKNIVLLCPSLSAAESVFDNIADSILHGTTRNNE